VKLDWVYHLPDNLSKEQIRSYFLSVLSEKMEDALIDKETLGEALWKLSNQQWHTYEIVDADIKKRVEEWIINSLTGVVSKKFIELIGGIIGMLGLTDAYNKLKELYALSLFPTHIKIEFEHIFNEYGDNVEDPYKDLR
jgi:hypothetical protein